MFRYTWVIGCIFAVSLGSVRSLASSFSFPTLKPFLDIKKFSKSFSCSSYLVGASKLEQGLTPSELRSFKIKHEDTTFQWAVQNAIEVGNWEFLLPKFKNSRAISVIRVLRKCALSHPQKKSHLITSFLFWQAISQFASVVDSRGFKVTRVFDENNRFAASINDVFSNVFSKPALMDLEHEASLLPAAEQVVLFFSVPTESLKSSEYVHSLKFKELSEDSLSSLFWRSDDKENGKTTFFVYPILLLESFLRAEYGRNLTRELKDLNYLNLAPKLRWNRLGWNLTEKLFRLHAPEINQTEVSRKQGPHFLSVEDWMSAFKSSRIFKNGYRTIFYNAVASVLNIPQLSEEITKKYQDAVFNTFPPSADYSDAYFLKRSEDKKREGCFHKSAKIIAERLRYDFGSPKQDFKMQAVIKNMARCPYDYKGKVNEEVFYADEIARCLGRTATKIFEEALKNRSSLIP